MITLCVVLLVSLTLNGLTCYAVVDFVRHVRRDPLLVLGTLFGPRLAGAAITIDEQGRAAQFLPPAEDAARIEALREVLRLAARQLGVSEEIAEQAPLAVVREALRDSLVEWGDLESAEAIQVGAWLECYGELCEIAGIPKDARASRLDA